MENKIKIEGTSAAHLTIAADDLAKQCPSAVSESVGQPDPKTMQQHIEEAAVTSARGKGNISDEHAMLELGGSTNEDVQIQTPEQQLHFVSSRAFSEQRCVYESQTNDKKKSLAAYENKQYVKEVGGTSAAQPIVPEDSMKQGPLAIPQAVGLPNPTTMQQQFKERASTSGTKNPKKMGKGGISESTAEHE
ncbi:uncharacterized protein LOC141882489 isoform X1 [Acropora palmata]|uniref:uncharacterized protein LOC141882489 isoform X1 n=1 Tax=Acropora palmata TaxID=6131 RepID=UPI003DA1C21B